MDPITISKLLSVADALEIHRAAGELSMDAFYEIVESQGKIKNLARRSGDILRVFEASHWIVRSAQDRNILCLTKNYNRLIHAWNSGDCLLPMSQGLINYPPYSDFLECLKQEQEIKIPQRQDKESRRDLGRKLKPKYGITFVAFDIFQTWAVSLGHAYRSPFKAILYWGGEWDAQRPSLEHFKTVCQAHYNWAEKTSGYANLGRLAHQVCRELRISFQAFEMKMQQFIERFPGEITLAPATIRREISGHLQITSIRSRKEIRREKLSAKLLPGSKRSPIQWIERRYLEDGVHINGKLVKLIRWED
ncbi:hypothetical protein F4X10_20130 [Candidatus Poribacteria bacterium]|nr:hypothetical protein [Candidatus Poribacteria bacterium]